MKRLFHFFSALFLLLAACGNTLGQAGSLDASFGDGGYVKTSLGNEEGRFSTLLLQPDGKIVAIGTQHHVDSKVLRYQPDGTLDNSFGVNGVASLEMEACIYTHFGAAALQSDGKILTAFTEAQGDCPSVLVKLARLHSDGKLDESFGDQGILDLSYLGVLENLSSQMLVYPDGDFVLFGSIQNPTGNYSSILVAKFNEDGSPDLGFGQGGVLNIPTNIGQVVNLKATFHAYGRLLIGASGYSNGKIELYRVNEFGTMDGTFGTNGKVELQEPEVAGIATLPDGRILVGASSGFSLSDFALAAMLLATGEPDASFGINGVAKIDFNETCHATGLASQADGKILVGGMAGLGSDEDYFLTRFLANGMIDNTFGTNGIAKHLDAEANHCATALQIQPDGKLVLGGFTVDGQASMARFNLEGASGVDPKSAPVSCYRLSPNPSNGHAELRFSLLEGGLTQFSLSNLAGEVIWQTEKWLSGGEQVEMLDFPDLPAGMYFVKISNAGGSAVDKMVRN